MKIGKQVDNLRFFSQYYNCTLENSRESIENKNIKITHGGAVDGHKNNIKQSRYFLDA